MGHAINRALESIRGSIPEDVNVNADVPTNLPMVLCGPNAMQQVIRNLCENAADAMSSGGELSIHICLKQSSIDSGSTKEAVQQVQLTVSDTGEGILEDIRDRVFDPFFSTREQALHSGLGLSVVLGVVEQIDGQINIDSKPGSGTQVIIKLPAIAEKVACSDSPDHTAYGAAREFSLLVVSDSAILSKISCSQLESTGFQITRVADGIRAMYAFNKNPFQFNAIVVDEIAQSMAGIELIERVRQVHPDIPLIYCSESFDERTHDACRRLHVTSIMQKPFCDEELMSRIQMLLLEKTA